VTNRVAVAVGDKAYEYVLSSILVFHSHSHLHSNSLTQIHLEARNAFAMGVPIEVPPDIIGQSGLYNVPDPLLRR
jgi:hypothetical protein